MVKVSTAVTLFLLLLAACAPPPTGTGGYTYDPAVNATMAARQAQDAAATYEAVQRATAVSVESTAVAVANATGTVQAAATQTAQSVAAIASQTAVAATSTSESLSVRATNIALDAIVVANQQAAEATRIAVQAEEARLAQEALVVEMARQDKARMLENMRAREAMWNNIIFPTLVAVITAVLIGLIIFGAVYLWRTKQPVINVHINGRDVPMILDGKSGGYKLLPQHVMGDVLALPAASTGSVQAEPLPALTQGHVLVAGPTRSGKTTALLAISRQRRDVVVLDPHGAPGKWGEARMIGAGRNFEEIAAFMTWMERELNHRAQVMATDAQATFPEMTVATDEMPSIAAELGRDVYGVWQKWVREGWKYGLYFVVSTQSTRVKTMGIEGEGDVLQNFVAAILLGSEAVNGYPELVAGMQRPAVIRTIDGVKPVIIPHVGTAPTPPANGHIAPPVINLPNPRSQAEADGRLLDGVIVECDSLNDVGRVLMDTDPDNTETRPSGQMLRERVRPALAWRINYLSCPDSSRILTGR